MRWPKDATDWPLTDHSRIVQSPPHRWHVQEAGTGPLLLLLHGAGGATQSWRNLFPLLAETHRVVAIDLPGQGFTQLGARQRCGLPPMAQDIATLCAHEGWEPAAYIGHSAGAVLALQLTLLNPEARVIGINAALGKFDGVAGWLFPAMAKMLALTPFVPDLFAATAGTPGTVRRLIEGTGSQIGDTGIALYKRLITDRDHVDATLAMMSQWELDDLLAALPSHPAHVTLIAGANDRTVPPAISERAAAQLPHATLHILEHLGHLAHEEDAATIAKLIRDALAPDPAAPT
ncbi:alpha/beta fold hydrolase BchO [Aestuariibius sp. 2305UL40-4]|uniref:alpha/beta fold hydrolase BchO n=1 Tax=Aestuariibius violaceus TaxID=3234132 RepID=UPI00345EA214